MVDIDVQCIHQSESVRTLGYEPSVFKHLESRKPEWKQTSVACRLKKRWVCEPLACTSSAVCEERAARSHSQLWPALTGCRSWCQKLHSCIIITHAHTHTDHKMLFLTCISADIRCIARGQSLRMASAHTQPHSRRQLLWQTLTLSNNFLQCWSVS